MDDVKAFDFLNNKCITIIKKWVNFTCTSCSILKIADFFSVQQVQYNLFIGYIPRISYIALTTYYAVLNSLIKLFIYSFSRKCLLLEIDQKKYFN